MNIITKTRNVLRDYRHLTQDNTYASRVEDGKLQLVRVTYDPKGVSTIEECGPWLPVAEWIEWMKKLCAD